MDHEAKYYPNWMPQKNKNNVYHFFFLKKKIIKVSVSESKFWDELTARKNLKVT